MDQLSEEMKKVLQAGLGAIAAGAEKVQEAVEILSKKGEPIYEQAKSAVSGAAGSIKKAVSDSGIGEIFSGKPRLAGIVNGMRQLSLEELKLLRTALDEICAAKEQEAQAAAQAEQTPAEEEAPAESGNGDDTPQE